MEHPDEGVIHAWLDGALSDDEAAALEAHVASCEPCSVAVAEARGLIAASSRIVSALDDVPGDVIPRDASPRDVIARAQPTGSAPRAARSWWKARGLAAAALVIVVAGSAVLTMPGGFDMSVSAPGRAETSDSAAVATGAGGAGGAAGAATAAPAPSELGTAMDEAKERERTERSSELPAAAPMAVMSAPAGRPAAAAVPRATSPAKPRAEFRTDSRHVPLSGTVASVTDASVANAAARAITLDSNRINAVITTSVATAAKDATAPPTAPVPPAVATAASAPAPAQGVASTARASRERSAAGATSAGAPALPSSPLGMQAFAPATLTGCYTLSAEANAPAAGRLMPRSVRLTDTLSGPEGFYLARGLESSTADTRLLWKPNGPAELLLRIITRGEMTQLRVRLAGEGQAEGVATKVGC